MPYHPPSHHHLYIIHLIDTFYRITMSLKRSFVPKSDVKQWFTTTTKINNKPFCRYLWWNLIIIEKILTTFLERKWSLRATVTRLSPSQYGVVYYCAALCTIYSFFFTFWTIYSIYGRPTFFIIICRKKGCDPPPHTHTHIMYPPLFWVNKLLKALINSVVDISGETYIF